MNHTAEVYMWGTRIGIIHLEDAGNYTTFEYDRDFVRSRIEIAPICMPLSETPYAFPGLSGGAFHGTPGLIADSLPDKFGNAIITQWLAEQGRSESSFNVIDRLCYTGSRGMGALEYVPVTGPAGSTSDPVSISEMVRFASQILSNREKIHLHMDENLAAKQLLLLGTSAGGARAKAVIAWNEKTGDIRSGQIDAGKGYGYWLIKFDGIEKNGDHGLEDAPHYTRIEYAYYQMALESKINMMECRLLSENGRSHFMTKRFDRIDGGKKIHMQTLAALAHIDYDIPCLCSYEQMGMYARRLHLPEQDIEQLYRRMVFNVLAVNQDDHVKNFSFLMDRNGVWSLSPAYDLTFAYDSSNQWLSAHQMTVNGKNKEISEADLLAAGRTMDISAVRCKKMLDDVRKAVDRWPEFAARAGVPEQEMERIREFHRESAIPSPCYEVTSCQALF